MWRHKSFSEIHDSDQSISDVDEEYDRNWQENCVSLAGTSERNRENMGVASQLELLKGFRQKDLSFSSEDEVEVPEFHQRNLDCNSNAEHDSIIPKTNDSIRQPDERISCVEKEGRMLFKSTTGGNNVSEMFDIYAKRNRKQFEPCTYEVDTDARTLDQLTEDARRSACCPFNSKDKNTGSSCKIKRSSSSQIQALKQGSSCSVWNDKNPILSSDDELLDETEASEYLPVGKTSSAVFGACDGETSKASLAALQYDHCGNSMAELLDNRQGKIRNLALKPKKGVLGDRRKELGQSAVRNMSPSGKDTLSDEDPCEFMHGGSSTDKEDNAQISEHAIVESERKTMADKFQEAFGCASADDRRLLFAVPKQSSGGLFGRLQHIMQQQKEQDAEFLKKVQNEVWPKDEARCIDVKILSRSFDAKLSVCHCSLLENEESSLQNPQQETFGKMWTVIFNSRVCGDVDLEVGNLIRIYPPWKEVQVLRGGEIIILTTYFSQIHT